MQKIVEIDTIPEHLPQAWTKPRGVPTQFSFGGDEEDGGDEVEGLLSSGFHGRGSPS